MYENLILNFYSNEIYTIGFTISHISYKVYEKLSESLIWICGGNFPQETFFSY